MNEEYLLDAGQVFIIFFVMLGPLKMLGPFLKATHKMTEREIHKLATVASLFASIALVFGGLLGLYLLQNWNIEVPILTLTGGVIFLLTGLLIILDIRKDTKAKDDETVTAPGVVYSMIVTPYGMATVITLLALSQSRERTLLVLSILLGVMVLNLLSMLFIRQIMGKVMGMTLQMLGAVLGILQAAMAMELIFYALRLLKIVQY